MPLAGDNHKDYTHAITRHLANGDSITSGPQRGTETELVVPPPQLPAAGKLDVIVRGFAVDFAATAFIDVTPAWSHGAREER